MIILNMLIITVIVCFIIDYSGFIPEIEQRINKRLKTKIFHIDKPISCSLCMSFWINLLYIIILGNFTLSNALMIVIFSGLSSSISDLMFLIKGVIDKIITVIGNKLNI